MNVVDLRKQLARADWEIGRYEPKTKLTFHWAGPRPAHPPRFDAVERAKIFARYHRSKDWGGGARGDGLMYHYVLGDDVIYIARDPEAVLYATGTDANRTSLHALFPVFEGESPTPGMYRAAGALAAAKHLPTQGHRDEGTSACPGDEIAAWIVRPEEEMTEAEVNALIDRKLAAYGERLQPELEVDRRRIDNLEAQVSAINVAGEHEHDAIATVTIKTSGPVKR